MLETKAPGRICFFGDHQDYLTLPVIAGTIDRFIKIKGKPNGKDYLQLKLINFDSELKINLKEPLKILKKGDYLRSSIRVLNRNGITLNKGYDVEIKGDIPINAGLSSSSALTVAWLRFLVKAAVPDSKFDDEQFARWAFESEVLEFNEAGGLMDQYTISIGGLLYINTLETSYKQLKVSMGKIIVGDSGIKKKTQDILQRLKDGATKAIEMIEKYNPSFRIHNAKKKDFYELRKNLPFDLQPYFYAAVFNHEITQSALLEFNNSNCDLNKISQLINAHQDILDKKLNNTPNEMIRMMDAAKSAGAKATKIVGSGGGGCFLAMIDPQDEKKVLNSILNAGAVDAFSVKLI